LRLYPLPRLRDSLPPEYHCLSCTSALSPCTSYLSRSLTDISVTLSPSVAIRFSRFARHSEAPSPSPSGDSGVRISPTRSPLLPSPFFALFASFSSPPRCPSLLLLIASMYLLCVYLSFFFSLTHSFSLSRCFCLTRACKPRNSVEYARRRVFDTLCSVSEGSVRRFHGEASFSTNAVARASSLFFFSRTGMNSLPVSSHDNKRINDSDRRIVAFVRRCPRDVQRDFSRLLVLMRNKYARQMYRNQG